MFLELLYFRIDRSINPAVKLGRLDVLVIVAVILFRAF